MWSLKIWILCVILTVNSQDYDEEQFTSLEMDEKNLSGNILLLLEHFKQPDPIGLPGEYIPDPFPVPDIKKSLFFGTTMYFKDTAIYGIGKFRILFVYVDIGRMQVNAALNVDTLQARGNYTKSPWLGKVTHGPYVVDINGLKITVKATLSVDREGKLITDNVEIDAEFNTIKANFEHLDLIGETFQGLINSAGSFLFNSIKPHILKEAHVKIRSEINAKLNEISGDLRFPNSISPLDIIMFDLRERVRDLDHLDPFQIENMNTEVNIFRFNLHDTSIFGMSSFYRVDNITLIIENNTITIDLAIGTQKLKGTTQWNISAMGRLLSAGVGSFSVEYISARIVVSQSLDTRRTPILEEIKIEVGNTQIRCDTGGTTDYVVELAINLFPNLLRFQIIDGIEGPLKERIQQDLNTLNVEEIIKEHLPKLDEMYCKGFKLSDLKEPDMNNTTYDEDEFFNF